MFRRVFFEMSIAKEQKIGKEWVHYLNLYYFAILKFELMDYNSSFELIEECLNQYDLFPDALYFKALILHKKNKNYEALATIEKSLQSYRKGLTNNEDNEIYVNYPYQIKENDILHLQKRIINAIK